MKQASAEAKGVAPPGRRRSSFALRGVDDFERRDADEILSSGVARRSFFMWGASVCVLARQPDAVGHRGINLDHHDVPPIGAVRSPLGRLTPSAAHRRSTGPAARAAIRIGAGQGAASARQSAARRPGDRGGRRPRCHVFRGAALLLSEPAPLRRSPPRLCVKSTSL